MKKLNNKKLKLTIKLVLIFCAVVLTFSFLYCYSGTFEGSGIKQGDSKAKDWDYLYFSVVTITTLGYGDFSPIGYARVIASIEAIFGLIFAGYSISQVLSVKQDIILDYIADGKVLDTYKGCVAKIVDAKEEIGDRRRLVEKIDTVEDVDFIYNRSNPFYSSLKSLQSLNGYTNHIDKVGKIKLVEKQVERACHHIEELTGFTRNYITELNKRKVIWYTPRTKKILNQLCNAVEEFVDRYVEHTKYSSSPYKGGESYSKVTTSSIDEIKQLCREFE